MEREVTGVKQVGNGMEQVGNRVEQEVTGVEQVGNRGGAGR